MVLSDELFKTDRKKAQVSNMMVQIGSRNTWKKRCIIEHLQLKPVVPVSTSHSKSAGWITRGLTGAPFGVVKAIL